ncbi:MAG: thiamine pyrophosphate-binding protein, partial [Candidatus Eremiobacteraeota bacterium]|nr:thiamine pyrophosphate-binding protein [Candidatus Eremiobacteraeota bacterium]
MTIQPNGPSLRTGGQLVVDALRAHGVDTLFCVPGESYLEVLDALVDAPSIRVVVCRHEAGAANMAEAYGKLTGRPGICFVTRGPGAAHAAIGCHIARQDSTPMILFVGQVERGASDREAFQEVDLRSMFASLSKWAGQIEDPRRIPELVSRAFHLAVSGRPGPVVLGLPEDMLVERARAAAVGPYRVVRPSPSGDDMTTLRAMLEKAQRPFMILGGGGWDDQACVDIRAFAEANVVPVGCAFRRQDLFDNRHELYAGDVGLGINPALARRVRDADLIIAVGDRLGEATTSGYTLIEPPRPAQSL